MNLWAKNKQGFTIVELLIVVVVIAILASVTVVGYSGIQQRAKVAIAKSDLRTLSQQMELFKQTNGAYPDSNNPPVYPEFETILKASNLYTPTRQTSADAVPEKSFVFCPYKTNDRYLIIAVRPVFMELSESSVGETIYYTSSSGGMQQTTFKWDSSITGSGLVGKNLCKSVDPVFNVNNGGIWSYHVPTSYAP